MRRAYPAGAAAAFGACGRYSRRDGLDPTETLGARHAGSRAAARRTQDRAAGAASHRAHGRRSGARRAAHEAARQAPRARRHRAGRPRRHRPRLRRGADRRGRGGRAELPPLLVGHVPEPRPAAARRSGHPAGRPARRLAVRACSTTAIRWWSSPRDRPTATVGEVRRRGELLARGRGARPRARARRNRGRAGCEIGEALERFAHNTIEHMREERELLAGQDRAAAIRRPTSATARRSSSFAASVTSATCGRCVRSSATCVR